LKITTPFVPPNPNELLITYSKLSTSLALSIRTTGDFLFNGEAGVGRDDLPSGRPKIHFEALSVLNRFDDEVMVQSGHDPPGTVMRTLGWNRKNNPILKMETYAEYIAWQERQWEILGPVTQIKIAVPANIFAEAPESDVTNKPS